MAAFERLEKLGPEKFRIILNALMRGEPAMTLARRIRSEWGDFATVQEKTLTQQLSRLRVAAAEGAFGKTTAQHVIESGTASIPALQKVSISVLEQVQAANAAQLIRLEELRVKERELLAKPGGAPVGLIKAVTLAYDTYLSGLDQAQKSRFDLGIDEFNGVVPGTRTQSASVTLPDGTTVQAKVMEAYNRAEEILNRRNIPHVIDITPT